MTFDGVAGEGAPPTHPAAAPPLPPNYKQSEENPTGPPRQRPPTNTPHRPTRPRAASVSKYFDSTTAYCVDKRWDASWRELRDAIREEIDWECDVYFATRSGAGVEAFAQQAENASSWSGSRYDWVVVLGGWNSDRSGRPDVMCGLSNLMRVLAGQSLRLDDQN